MEILIRAKFSVMCDPGGRSCDEDVEMAECSGVLSATQEACQAELAEAMCATTSSTEASAAAAAEDLGGQPGRPLQEADWQEVVYKVSRMCSVNRPAAHLQVKQQPVHQLAQQLTCSTWQSQ